MKALIIYDDLTGATRAAAALRRAALAANVGADWDIKPWRTDALKFSSAANKALIEAADADLIVLAGPQAHSLPTWLEEWLRYWVIRRNIEDAALAVLYDESDGVLVVPDAPDLSQFARSHSLRLITENEATTEGQTLSTPRAQSARRGLWSKPRKLRAHSNPNFLSRLGNQQLSHEADFYNRWIPSE